LLNTFNRIWDFFVSVKLSVVLLLSLAGASIIGTVVPQNESPDAYLQAYGEVLYRIFYTVDIFDMYHSWWFQLLLVLLTINVVVCSIDRFAATWKIVFVKNPPFNISKFRNQSDTIEFADSRLAEDLKKKHISVASNYFGYKRIEDTDRGFCIFAEKWRWTRLGAYMVHLSVILLLLGGLIGSMFGFEGFVNIAEGETVNSIRLRYGNRSQALDFEVRCDDFNVSFYDSGMPSEYRSSLTVLEQGKPVLHKDIIVNDPLRYKGINFFQSSYGSLSPKEITLKFTSRATGREYDQKALIGEPFDLPEDKGTFMLKGYRPSFSFRGNNLGEIFIANVTPKHQDPVDIILPLRFPEFDRMRKGDFIVSVSNYNPSYYTGLQVTRDPGVWVVYSGFIFIILGCYITFFMSHQRLCIEVAQSGKKSKVLVAGTANKNKVGMQNRVKKISEKLKSV